MVFEKFTFLVFFSMRFKTSPTVLREPFSAADRWAEKDKHAMKLAKLLRKEGVSCIMTSEKPGKAMELANSLGVQRVVFIGDEEVSQKKFKMRDMKTGEERLLSELRLISALKK